MRPASGYLSARCRQMAADSNKNPSSSCSTGTRPRCDPPGARTAQPQAGAEFRDAIGVEDLLWHLRVKEQRHTGDERLLHAVEPAVGEEEACAAQHGEPIDLSVRAHARR